MPGGGLGLFFRPASSTPGTLAGWETLGWLTRWWGGADRGGLMLLGMMTGGGGAALTRGRLWFISRLRVVRNEFTKREEQRVTE